MIAAEKVQTQETRRCFRDLREFDVSDFMGRTEVRIVESMVNM